MSLTNDEGRAYRQLSGLFRAAVLAPTADEEIAAAGVPAAFRPAIAKELATIHETWKGGDRVEAQRRKEHALGLAVEALADELEPPSHEDPATLASQYFGEVDVKTLPEDHPRRLAADFALE